MKIMFFDDAINFRLTEEQVKDVKKIINKDKFSYPTESEFFRSALVRWIRIEKERLRIK